VKTEYACWKYLGGIKSSVSEERVSDFYTKKRGMLSVPGGKGTKLLWKNRGVEGQGKSVLGEILRVEGLCWLVGRAGTVERGKPKSCKPT